MDNLTARKLQSVGQIFNPEGPFYSYEEITMGNVNHTRLVSMTRYTLFVYLGELTYHCISSDIGVIL